jgi:hypothetical protein
MNETPDADLLEHTTLNPVNRNDLIRKLVRERDELRRMSVIEMMGENLNVKHHVTEWENRCLKAERERDELQEKYDTLAVENMLEVNKLCNQRDAAIDALMKIEDIFIDGDDTYEDWKSMGQIARTFLENTYESRINKNN